MTIHAAAARSTRSPRWLLIVLLIALFITTSGSSAPLDAQPAVLPVLGGGGGSAEVAPPPAPDAFDLHIPGINVHINVEEAYVRGDSWDFSTFTQEAAHLQLTAFPGQGSNVVIGAHYELANFVPGPFIQLDQVQVGDQISLDYQGLTYIYEVSELLVVTPTDIQVAYRTPQEMLTLLTCYDYAPSSGVYARRFVVRAPLVAVLHG
jgi:LPXTG-site transpeptidase (sortase) family protein